MQLNNAKWAMLPIAVALAGALAAGCGGPAGDESQTPSTSPPSSTAPTSASSDGAASAGKDGKTLFDKTCATCHGQDAKGLEGLGKDLTTSQFAKDKSEDDLVAFFKEGRPSSHPDNTTKVDMPPKGGNPALTDDDLKAIAEYVKEINTL